MKMLEEIIRGEIASQGVMPFARFMELALYSPGTGYYERKKNPGRQGDFYTSVSVGELFGQLLAFQFSEWLEELRSASLKIQIVEAGAHDGRLARDILSWIQQHRPETFARLEYCLVEPSPTRREWQRETLKDFIPNARWISQLDASTQQSFEGIIFSNELLDAFPVHRLGWDAKAGNWFEWGVGLDGGNLVHARMEHAVPSALRPQAPPELLAVLPDHFTIEISPAAGQWWRDAAGGLRRGKLVVVDYGLAEDELFLPSRKNGTLRAYSRHHHAADVLANAGEQDLTAHVNFSALQTIGESCGLATESFATQSQFLTRILEKTTKSQAPFGEWTPARARQFQTLTHPEHLGRAFRVLVQSRSDHCKIN
ncbi:MAG TPA: SAM-dependent methyltransferase [Verrucomicrobiae bacterium]|jgi:SAM-dependent MidA family methyltransferase